MVIFDDGAVSTRQQQWECSVRLSPNHIARRVTRVLFRPRIRVAAGHNTIRLGSDYGGWTFVDEADLAGSTILSFGLGEDASFDVDFAARYGATILIFDPTPRAIAHFGELSRRIGASATRPYGSGGHQPSEAYDLSTVTAHQLQLFPLAVSDESGTAKFFAPADARHVSHSLVNLQIPNDHDASFITVDVISVDELTSYADLRAISLVKMDIEGAEILVLRRMLETSFLPNQLLVEYDELNFPSRAARKRFDSTHQQILDSGYSVSHWDKRSCISYIRRAFA